jgi:hypothetical protein
MLVTAFDQHRRIVFPLGVGYADRTLAGKRLAIGGLEHDRERLQLRRCSEERHVVQGPNQRAAARDRRPNHDEREDDEQTPRYQRYAGCIKGRQGDSRRCRLRHGGVGTIRIELGHV